MAIKNQKVTISVIGAHQLSPEGEHLAHKVGEIVAEVGAVFVCGGLDGAMKVAAKGAKSKGGLTIGLLPGTDKADANDYIDIALPSSFGYARNAMVACSADIIIALPGSHGTCSEVCYGLVYKRPVIDLGGWGVDGMIRLGDVGELKAELENIISQIR